MAAISDTLFIHGCYFYCIILLLHDNYYYNNIQPRFSGFLYAPINT